jgi:hypothetical protein
MGEFEAAGDAVTGGLLARAVEPQAGEGDGHTHEKACLNCGTLLSGPYCFACGQKAHVHRSVRAFFQDFVQGLFNFESKIWRTLPMLAWCPGVMTRRYIAGERARFISPAALYLFTVFAMFAVLNLTGTLDNDVGASPKSAVSRNITARQQALRQFEAQRQAASAARKPTADLDRLIAGEKQAIAAEQKLLSGQAFASGKVDGDTPGWVRPLVEQAMSDPGRLSLKIQDAASKFSWLLIPLSVPFMWLLFPLRRRYNTYDHVVFVTYSLSFMMMLVIAGGIIVAVRLPTLASLLFFVPPVHMYRHLKQAYELGRFSAIMRTIALVTFAFIAIALFAAAIVAIGAA